MTTVVIRDIQARDFRKFWKQKKRKSVTGKTVTKHIYNMNEVIMVPSEELNRLSNYYQGKITESALVNKAGRLAAEQQLILEDKSIPAQLWWGHSGHQRGSHPF